MSYKLTPITEGAFIVRDVELWKAEGSPLHKSGDDAFFGVVVLVP